MFGGSGSNLRASISWNPRSKYSYTTAEIYYTKDTGNYPDDYLDPVTYSNYSPYMSHVTKMAKYTSGQLPASAASFDDGDIGYYAIINLDVDRTKTFTTPTSGDTIGSITVTLSTIGSGRIN